MPTVFVSHIFRDQHDRMPWRYEVGGAVESGSRAQTSEKAEEMRDRQISYLATRHDVIEVDVREMAVAGI